MGTINENPPKRRRVGLIFDDRMCKHSNPREEDHHENPNRIRAIWDKLNASGLVQRCVVLNAKKVEDNHVALVHSKEHIDLIKTISFRSSTMSKVAAKFDSIYFNEGSSTAAYLAAGSVIEAAERVAKGDLDSAFAIVRPPGHHAEQDKPMGFCLYNNVAIATSFLLNERPDLGIRKILIVDWDVHHGNGTQKMFYEDPRVLVFSVHRHESGRFYPRGNDGSYNMTGEGPGGGYNINVPWESGGCGDADYIAVWDHILIPVTKEFDPDMIIISAGFDAAIGDPVGGCFLSPHGYSLMLDKLMSFARGRIVMALEGGYNLVSLANSAQACIEVLLKDKPLISSLEDLPLKSTWLVIQTVRQELSRYWPALAATLPDKLINSNFEVDASLQDEVDVPFFTHQTDKKLFPEGGTGGFCNTVKRRKTRTMGGTEELGSSTESLNKAVEVIANDGVSIKIEDAEEEEVAPSFKNPKPINALRPPTPYYTMNPPPVGGSSYFLGASQTPSKNKVDASLQDEVDSHQADNKLSTEGDTEDHRHQRLKAMMVDQSATARPAPLIFKKKISKVQKQARAEDHSTCEETARGGSSSTFNCTKPEVYHHFLRGCLSDADKSLDSLSSRTVANTFAEHLSKLICLSPAILDCLDQKVALEKNAARAARLAESRSKTISEQKEKILSLENRIQVLEDNNKRLGEDLKQVVSDKEKAIKEAVEATRASMKSSAEYETALAKDGFCYFHQGFLACRNQLERAFDSGAEINASNFKSFLDRWNAIEEISGGPIMPPPSPPLEIEEDENEEDMEEEVEEDT